MYIPEFMEDMAADRNGLEVLDDGLEIFVADGAYCFGKGVVSEHASPLLSLPVSDSPPCAPIDLLASSCRERGVGSENGKMSRENLRAG